MTKGDASRMMGVWDGMVAFTFTSISSREGKVVGGKNEVTGHTSLGEQGRAGRRLSSLLMGIDSERKLIRLSTPLSFEGGGLSSLIEEETHSKGF